MKLLTLIAMAASAVVDTAKKAVESVKSFLKPVAVGAGALALSGASHAGPIDDMFASIDLTTVAAAVLAIGLVIIGIAMSYKGVDLSKRAVRKV